jgi:hypothetical protein
LSAADLRLLHLTTPSVPRQTAPYLPRLIGPISAWFVWGFDIALGFSTIRVTSLYWALVLILMTSPSVWSPVILFFYVLGFVLGLLSVLLYITRWSRENMLSQLVRMSMRRTPLTLKVSGIILAGYGIFLLSSNLRTLV